MSNEHEDTVRSYLRDFEEHIVEVNSQLRHIGGVLAQTVRPDDGAGLDLRAMWTHQEVKRIREHTMYIRIQLGVLLFVVICFVVHRW